MEKELLLNSIELAYLKVLSSEDIVPDCLIISKNIFQKIKSDFILTMKVYYSSMFEDDDFVVCKIGMMIDILEFNSNGEGELYDKIAIMLLKHINQQ